MTFNYYKYYKEQEKIQQMAFKHHNKALFNFNTLNFIRVMTFNNYNYMVNKLVIEASNFIKNFIRNFIRNFLLNLLFLNFSKINK